MWTKLLVKTVLYRVYSMGIAFLFFWFLLGEIKLASGYTIFLELIKVLQYYCFEVFWQRFNRNASTID